MDRDEARTIANEINENCGAATVEKVTPGRWSVAYTIGWQTYHVYNVRAWALDRARVLALLLAEAEADARQGR